MLVQLPVLQASDPVSLATSLGLTGAMSTQAHYLNFGSVPTEMSLSMPDSHEAVNPEYLEFSPLIFIFWIKLNWIKLKTRYSSDS